MMSFLSPPCFIKYLPLNFERKSRFFSSKISPNLPLDWQEKQQLLAIAKQCPEKGGVAVYWARAWYGHLTGDYIEESDCVSSRNSDGYVQEKKETTSSYSLFPNPASHQVTISGPELQDGEAMTISLFSPLGQIMKTLPYSPSGKTSVPIKNMVPGIYWCKVADGKKDVFTQRFIILK